MNIAIIQARMNSTRLPGKSMMKICNKPVIGHVYDRVSQAILLNKIYVATGSEGCNRPIVDYCHNNNINYYIGDNENVLKRYCDLMSEIGVYETDNIIRITADCPLVDGTFIDRMLSIIDIKTDYIGNQNNMIDGFDIEIIKAKHLYSAYEKYGYDEHVTLKWKQNNHEKLTYLWHDKNDRSKIHLSLDTKEDFENIKNIFEKLYPENYNFLYQDVLKLMRY